MGKNIRKDAATKAGAFPYLEPWTFCGINLADQAGIGKTEDIRAHSDSGSVFTVQRILRYITTSAVNIPKAPDVGEAGDGRTREGL